MAEPQQSEKKQPAKTQPVNSCHCGAPAVSPYGLCMVHEAEYEAEHGDYINAISETK